MEDSFEIVNECFAPGCHEGAELAVVTISDFMGGITIELCSKHSETVALEIMRMYNLARKRWAEERDKARREAKARQERGQRSKIKSDGSAIAELRPKVIECS